MDPNLIPTIGGLVLLGAIWTAALFGRAYVRRLQVETKREAERPSPD